MRDARTAQWIQWLAVHCFRLSSAAAVASVLLAMMPTATASKDTGVRASQASYLNNLRYTLADKGEPSASSICT